MGKWGNTKFVCYNERNGIKHSHVKPYQKNRNPMMAKKLSNHSKQSTDHPLPTLGSIDKDKGNKNSL